MPAPPRGSFRGVGFYTESHDTAFGRRQPNSPLPFKDRGVAFSDLGRAPREFTINAFVVGDNYRAQRDALIKAFETPGAGVLVHPEHGRVSVIVENRMRVRESVTEGTNKATITFRALETFDQPPAQPLPDTGSALKNAARAGRSATALSFANPATGLKAAISDFVKAAHLDVLDSAITDFRAINGTISSVLAVPAGFAAQIDALALAAAELIDTPRRLIDSIEALAQSLMQSLRRVISPDGTEDVDLEDVAPSTSPLRRGAVLFRVIAPTAAIASGVPAVPDIDTEERRDQAAGQLAIQRHVQAIGLLSLAEAGADVPIDSTQDAIAIRDALVRAIVALADTEPDMDAPVLTALKTTAAAAHAHFTTVAGRLPTVVEYTPADTIPAEVIAWQLYADAERADEIVARNPAGVQHPGFVQGKIAIEVADT